MPANFAVRELYSLSCSRYWFFYHCSSLHSCVQTSLHCRWLL